MASPAEPLRALPPLPTNTAGEAGEPIHWIGRPAARLLLFTLLFYVTAFEPISPRLGETDVRLLWIPGALLGYCVWALPRPEVPAYVLSYAVVRLAVERGPMHLPFEIAVIAVEIAQALILAFPLRRHLRREQLIMQPVRVVAYPLLALCVTGLGASAVMLAATLFQLSPQQMAYEFAGNPELAWRHWWLGQTCSYITVTGSINFLAQVNPAEIRSFFAEKRRRLGYALVFLLLLAVTLVVMPIADLSFLGMSAEVRLGLTMVPASIAFAMTALFLGFGAAVAILTVTAIAFLSVCGPHAAANWEGLPSLVTPHVYLTMMAATCWVIAATSRQMYWAKQEVIEASKLRPRLAGLLTEELRNQLDALVGVSEQMQERDQHPPTASYRPLENIQASSQRLLATIEALIDQAEFGASIFELDKLPVRVSGALQDAADQVRSDCARLGCHVSVTAEPELIVEADPKALRQMLLVLLSYPLRFVGPGGAIAVSGCRSGADTIVEVRSTGLINAVADDRDKIELQLVGALALAHGARLTTIQQERSGRVSGLTFFATQAA